MAEQSNSFEQLRLAKFREQNCKLFDFTIRAVPPVDCEQTEKSFAVSKFILSSASPVLTAAFLSETVELANHEYTIGDFPPDSVGTFLEILHCGGPFRSHNLSLLVALDLLALSEKYQVEFLKSQCEDHLIAQIVEESFCRIVGAADLYQAASIMRACQKFLRDAETLNILSSKEWKELKCRQPSAAAEVLEGAFKCQFAESRERTSRRRCPQFYPEEAVLAGVLLEDMSGILPNYRSCPRLRARHN